MGLVTTLRDFKVPLAILDRFLETNGVEPTYGNPPFYHRSEPDPGSKFLRDKLHAAAGDIKTQIFMPELQGELESTYAYVAYAWVMLYAQRQLKPAEELPDRAPPGFSELRSEILGHTDGEDVETLQVRRLEEGGGDPAAALFVIVADRRLYSFQSDLRCDRCDVIVDRWELRQAHRWEVHGLE
ncbi:hypothetical protein C8A05DRAFT_19078 [Staphylotrichum tortipilum]|uniref:C2H2-type domain-containing protein n=1 Tax=Staphylotrichum tortipilum TaxID=2831512 RepID=A0AAN6MC93_9PEZI|nr:hypothetical protein C8A05DRAFT_19078 [Staphylotrichum longicolle]